MAIKKVEYKEPKSYFNEDMLKAAKEWDEKHKADMIYKESDEVMLKDGRVGTIVGVMADSYIVDIGDDEDSWETIDVKPEEIEIRINPTKEGV